MRAHVLAPDKAGELNPITTLKATAALPVFTSITVALTGANTTSAFTGSALIARRRHGVLGEKGSTTRHSLRAYTG
jgi:hypothetical protein